MKFSASFLKWTYYLRALFGLCALVILTFLMSLSILIIMPLTKKRDHVNGSVKAWVSLVLKSFGIAVEIKGLDKLPPYVRGQRGVLFLFNHTSFFDIFVLTLAQPMISFGAKIELFKIPVFGSAMKIAGVLPIDRKNRENVFNVYAKSRERVSKGDRFGLAPEGRRGSEEKLLPFKSGPFIFAISTGAIIVPVIIKGACRLWPKNSFIPTLGKKDQRRIVLEFLEPLSVEAYKIETRQELKDQVYERMKNYF